MMRPFAGGKAAQDFHLLVIAAADLDGATERRLAVLRQYEHPVAPGPLQKSACRKNRQPVRSAPSANLPCKVWPGSRPAGVASRKAKSTVKVPLATFDSNAHDLKHRGLSANLDGCGLSILQRAPGSIRPLPQRACRPVSGVDLFRSARRGCGSRRPLRSMAVSLPAHRCAHGQIVELPMRDREVLLEVSALAMNCGQLLQPELLLLAVAFGLHRPYFYVVIQLVLHLVFDLQRLRIVRCENISPSGAERCRRMTS